MRLSFILPSACREIKPCILKRHVFVKQLVVEVSVLSLVLRCLFRKVILVSLEAPSLHASRGTAP